MKICFECGNHFESIHWLCSYCHKEPCSKEGYYLFAPEFSEENYFFPANGFENLAGLEEKNFWFRARSRLILWAIKKYLSSAKNYLEIGCGTGLMLEAVAKNFPTFNLAGSEIYCTGLAYAKKRLNKQVQLFQMDARNIPFISEYDAIGAFDVLEHIKEDELVIRQLYQALRPGGSVIITVPQHQFLWSATDQYSFHYRRYAAKDLKNKLNNVGFTLTRMTSFVTFLLPIMFLSRLKRNDDAVKHDPASELKIKEPLNTILEKILYAEQLFIYSGMNYAFGGSLLLIAKKITG